MTSLPDKEQTFAIPFVDKYTEAYELDIKHRHLLEADQTSHPASGTA